jgi:hypothetical protein
MLKVILGVILCMFLIEQSVIVYRDQNKQKIYIATADSLYSDIYLVVSDVEIRDGMVRIELEGGIGYYFPASKLKTRSELNEKRCK